MKNHISVVVISLLFTNLFYSQEALKSIEEDYYDFLSLNSLVERPTIGYRTLSDSTWAIKQDQNGKNFSHIWQDNNLGTKKNLWHTERLPENLFTKGFYHGLKMKVYGPEWFNSYNTKAPYGQNDGALWQGKGYNTSFAAGVRLEGFGFEGTFKPQISFSQNKAFDYISPNYSGSNFTGKAEEYGYYGVKSVDAPQRFGKNPFWTYDWGDTEIRYTWYTFTMGFGTQVIWLGPAQINPIIHSNNAPSYPKFDFGLRKTQMYLPYFNLYIGDIETRLWWGKLTESDYFDNDDSNNENLMTGLSINYAFPGLLQGFSMGVNRTMLSHWNDRNTYTMLGIFVPGISNLTSGGKDDSDQRFSVTFDYLIEKVGFEIYYEWARNDFSPNMDFIIRYPFHTQGWTFGIKKAFDLSYELKLAILLEISNLECSADYDRLINWFSTFYAHHKITQGYTNRGQWLGAGMGTGGNSQYLGVNLLHKKGKLSVFAQRQNPDMDYSIYIDAKKDAENIANGQFNAEGNIRCLLSFGISANYFFNQNLQFNAKYVFTDERNPLNKSDAKRKSMHRYNNTVQIGTKLYL